MVAPALKMTVMKSPMMRINFAIMSDCSSKNFFSLGHEVLQTIVGSESANQAGEIVRILEPKSHRRKRAAFEGIHDLTDIAPDFRIKTASLRIEDSHNGPPIPSEFDLPADLRTQKTLGDPNPDYDFARSPVKHAPLSQPYLRP